jgi:4-hydroxy-2-oxoglutarate aldolase
MNSSPNQSADSLGGVFAPITTPFGKNEDLDLEALAFNIDFYAKAGIHGLLVLGSNGETRSVTEEEKLQVLAIAVQAKAPQQVIMAGAAYQAQRDTERYFNSAAELGADFGLLLAPSYFRKAMTDAVLFEYFTVAAERSPIPLLLYNAPGFSGISYSVELVTRLAEHPNIVGMKHSAASGLEMFYGLEGEQFHVLPGSANLLFPAMLAGSIGGTVALADVFPALVQDLFRFGVDQDQAAGQSLHELCSRLNNAISGTSGVSGVKAAMDLVGLRGGIPRRPLLPLRPEEIIELRDVLVGEGVLDD